MATTAELSLERRSEQARSSERDPLLLTDVHSGLGRARVAALARPRSVAELQEAVAACARLELPLSVGGGRHAMGGQPFLAGALHLDTSALTAATALDREAGVLEVEAGARWRDVVDACARLQPGAGERRWSIRQKQTGADRMCLGGSLAANAHGRGLAMAPLVADVESLELVDARGELRRCSRAEDPRLFSLAVGGYGLFGVIARVRLRLARRALLRRTVALHDAEEAVAVLEARREAGARFGDFQFAVDPASPDFLRRGVLSTYAPAPDAEAPAPGQRRLAPADWRELLRLAHVAKSEAFRRYAAHYLATDGQLYWSDEHQLATYVEGYHAELDRELGARVPGGEALGELFVPRPRLADFLALAREELRRRRADVVYGTVRLIEREDDTFLAWAREPWACVVLNLHVDREPRSVARAADGFRALIDAARALGGSYYLTYHRWASAEQARACHPRLERFFEQKDRLDSAGRFLSDWSRAVRAQLEGE